MDTGSVKCAADCELVKPIPPIRPGEDKIKVGSLSEMPQVGQAKEFRLGNKMLCIANVNSEICATNNSCPHLGASLSRGRIRDGKIQCPLHGWSFDLKTGETPVRATTRALIYKVIVDGEYVFVCPG